MLLFISSVVIVRIITKEEFAYLSYADNLYQYVSMFTGLGMALGILKFCSPKIDQEEDRFFFYYALKVGSLFQVFITILLIVYVMLSGITFLESRSLILALAVYPMLYYITQVLQSYLRAHFKNKLYMVTSLIQTCIVLILSVILAFSYNVYGIVVARYIAMLAAVFVGFKSLKIRKTAYLNVTEKEKLKSFWKMSLSLMIANIFSMIMPMNEMLLVSVLLKDESITANFRIATLIPAQLVFIVNSIIVYFFPHIVNISDNRKLAFNKIKKVAFFNALVIFVITIIGYTLNPIIIKFVYGEEYMSAVSISAFFWIAYAINGGIRMIPMNMLPALGKSEFNATIAIISALVHLILDYIFITKFGIVGAAFAIIFVYILSGVAYWLYLYFVCKKEYMV